MKLLIPAIILFAQFVVRAELPSDRIEEMKSGLQYWREVASKPELLPEQDRIGTLGQGLRKTSSSRIYALEGRIEVRDRLREVLLATPGHAEYYKDRIQSTRSTLNSPQSARRSELGATLRNEQMYGFQTLALLPSPETVRVLGEFLFDDEGSIPPSPPGQVDDQVARQWKALTSPNSHYALQAIAKLPLVSPPVQRRKNDFTIYDEDINSWRLWYEQIKAGTRTFRFEGDPQEYSLAGPVSTHKVADTGRAHRETPPPASAPPVVEESEQRKLPAGALAIAGALLAAATTLLIRQKLRRQTRAGRPDL